MDTFVAALSTGLPSDMVYSATGEGYISFSNCDDITIFSNLSIQLDNVVYTLPSEYYAYIYGDTCVLDIITSADDFWILGVTFL